MDPHQRRLENYSAERRPAARRHNAARQDDVSIAQDSHNTADQFLDHTIVCQRFGPGPRFEEGQACWSIQRLDHRWQTDALVADTLRPGGCVQCVLHHLPERQEVDLAWRRPAPRQPYTAAGLRFCFPSHYGILVDDAAGNLLSGLTSIVG
jgi:hypothetical protein